MDDETATPGAPAGARRALRLRAHARGRERARGSAAAPVREDAPSRRRRWIAVAALPLAGLAFTAAALSAGGDVRTVAGGGLGDGGPASSAVLGGPSDVVAAPGGGYYVADTTDNRVRRIDASGTITAARAGAPARTAGPQARAEWRASPTR